MEFIKSPLNQIGRKYALLPRLLPLFPKKIDTLADLFCGSCDISFNVAAIRKIANDSDPRVIGIWRAVKAAGPKKWAASLKGLIAARGLSRENGEAFRSLADDYNRDPDPLALCALLLFSRNNWMRFSRNGRFASEHGRWNCFSDPGIFSRLEGTIENIDFQCRDFREINPDALEPGDFVFADPPYLSACAIYERNCAAARWMEEDERDLYSLLEKIHNRGVKFIMTNYFRKPSGSRRKNSMLLEWIGKNGWNAIPLDDMALEAAVRNFR